jgi:hypothetical protein
MKRFTPEEDQYISNNYLTLNLQEMADHLNRALGSVFGRMERIGLVVPAEIKLERLQQSFKRLEESGKISRFPKGHVPANKGQKMSPEMYEKCKGTMFKPGQIPATCVHFGKPYLHQRIREDGNVERLWFIQESTNKRSAYLAYLCRKNGIDLTGKKPILKDGFDHSRAPTFEDIMIVTNAENMRRNSLHRYPPEVVKLCQLKGALQHQINKILQNDQEQL